MRRWHISTWLTELPGPTFYFVSPVLQSTARSEAKSFDKRQVDTIMSLNLYPGWTRMAEPVLK